jgi:hypothetical protein
MAHQGVKEMASAELDIALQGFEVQAVYRGSNY